MSKIDFFVSRLTTDETKETAIACLDQLDTDTAWQLVQEWIKDNNLAAEAGTVFGEELNG